MAFYCKANRLPNNCMLIISTFKMDAKLLKFPLLKFYIFLQGQGAHIWESTWSVYYRKNIARFSKQNKLLISIPVLCSTRILHKHIFPDHCKSYLILEPWKIIKTFHYKHTTKMYTVSLFNQFDLHYIEYSVQNRKTKFILTGTT